MIVVTLPFASEQSQCYKLHPTLRVLGSGTTCCSLWCHFQESGHNILLTNSGSSTFGAVKQGSPWPPSHRQRLTNINQ